jgi:hypothetical protein
VAEIILAIYFLTTLLANQSQTQIWGHPGEMYTLPYLDCVKMSSPFTWRGGSGKEEEEKKREITVRTARLLSYWTTEPRAIQPVSLGF